VQSAYKLYDSPALTEVWAGFFFWGLKTARLHSSISASGPRAGRLAAAGKAFKKYTRSPYKRLRNALIFSSLEFKMLKICPFLTIFLNTLTVCSWYSALCGIWHCTPG